MTEMICMVYYSVPVSFGIPSRIDCLLLKPLSFENHGIEEARVRELDREVYEPLFAFFEIA
jgi:hypothetical protein